MDILSTGSQAVNNYSPIVDLSVYIGDTSRNVAKTDDEYNTFAMYLYTNGASENMSWKSIGKINSGSLYDTILGINITDIANSPAPPKADDNISDITGNGKDETPGEITDDKSDIDIGKFYSRIADAVPFPIEEEKGKEAQFGDMYVKSSAYLYAFTEEEKNALSYDEYIEKSKENFSGLSERSDSLCVPVGAGELPRLMDDILRTLTDGGTLAEALQTQIDKYSQNESPQSTADLIWVNPDSGEVVGAYRKERAVDGSEWTKLFDDDNAVLRLADDLASFIRYAVFGLESDDPERVQEFIEHLKNKQAYADYGRYISDTNPDADILGIMELIIANLTAAGVIGGGNTDKEPDNTDIAESGAAEDAEENNGENTETALLIPETESTPELSPEEELEEILDSIADGKGGDNTGEETAAQEIG